ncbi:MAG TPA: glutamate--tRNA ligase, partial [Candidatus Omnitrophota bacterium]|nr:glutamate--tRNA ligase [Candidatus Omnitrophota bacterium]
MKVRFAPSPTGYLHIGGARTALFNWMYARSQKGMFVLRIEDTDLERSKKEYLDEIVDSMKWLGLSWDEFYLQSERFDIYRQHAQKLLDEGKAYKDGEAVILKIPAREIKLYDLIRGEIVFDSETIKDQVLMKSDGSPTYSFACVVDDALMEITHVIRGEDHISNTPKQMMIYEALGFKAPKFAHLPLIMDAEGGRMSKR